MRILHVSGWLAPRYGGSTAVVLQSDVSVASRGHDVEVITTNVDGPGVLNVPTGRPVQWDGVTATFHPLSVPRRFLTSWPMLADLRQRVAEVDLVHIHSLYRFHTIAAAVTARRRRVPYVIQAHGSLDAWHRNQKRRAKDIYHLLIEDSNLGGAGAILCTSRREESSIRDLGYAAPTWVIPIGVDADALRAPAPAVDLLAREGIQSDARIVSFLGRISAKKGVELLVESFRQTAETLPDVHLIVAGPDDEGIGRGLEPVIARLGLAGRVSFVGEVAGAEKRALLQHSAVFVLPSADESFGIAVAEAMAVGTPVVVSPDVGIEDVVRGAGAGIVAEREPLEVARAVGLILANPAAAAAMGEAGRRAIDEKFTLSRVGAELESMYRAVVAAASHRHRRKSARTVPPSEPAGSPKLPLICPTCRGPLRLDSQAHACLACDRAYPIVDGIPVLVPDLEKIQHDEIDHLHGGGDHGPGIDAHKTAQAEHFDRAVAEEFEIMRPHGTSRLYEFLLRQKFRRATAPIGPHLVGASALTVCGGSGMDAEFLARGGASVVASDLSIGAAQRTRERARRYQVDITPVVADIERLPFPNQSFDLVLVHDGLHHLERPDAGLREMARVARRWVSVTEPARAAATALAVRAGLALEREEAGNRVARLDIHEVVAVLRDEGFRPLVSERYAMYYRHEPGWVSRILSQPRLFPFVRTAWHLCNGLIGRLGNKMVVVSERARDDGTRT